jgi:hypothetical protein
MERDRFPCAFGSRQTNFLPDVRRPNFRRGLSGVCELSDEGT